MRIVKWALVFLALFVLLPRETFAQTPGGQIYWPHPPRASKTRLVRFAALSIIDCTGNIIINNWDWERCLHNLGKRAGFFDERYLDPKKNAPRWTFPPPFAPSVQFYPFRRHDFILRRNTNIFNIPSAPDPRKRIIERLKREHIFLPKQKSGANDRAAFYVH